MQRAQRYRESRRLILRGLAMLGLGSLLLLACKMQLSEAVLSLMAFAGGCMLLLGNGCMIFGLLIYADARSAGQLPRPASRP